MTNFSLEMCLSVPFFLTKNKSLQKDINDGAGDGKSNSFCNGLLLLVVKLPKQTSHQT